MTPAGHLRVMILSAQNAWLCLSDHQADVLAAAVPCNTITASIEDEDTVDELAELGLLEGDYRLTPLGALVRHVGLQLDSIIEAAK